LVAFLGESEPCLEDSMEDKMLHKGFLTAKGKVDRDVLLDRKKISLHQFVTFRESLILAGLLLVNICLFICANVLVGAVEHVKFGISKPISSIIGNPDGYWFDLPVYDFGLESSFKLMNDAGAHAIAYLILLLSSVWPYVKSILLGVMWFVPVTRTTREWTLWTLDILGKWSFLDFYFIMILGVAFKISGDLKIDGVLNGGSLGSLTLSIECVAGVLLFILSAMMSLALTQHAVSAHFRAMYGEKGQMTKQERLVFKNKFSGKIGMFVLYLVGSLVSLGIYCWGITQNVFTFKYSGMLPKMLNTSDVSYTLYEMGYVFPEATYNYYGGCATFFMILYYCFCFVFPFMLYVSVPLVWAMNVFDFGAEHRRNALHFVQGCGAWAATDVFLLALGAGTMQLNVVIQQSIIAAAGQYKLPPWVAENWPALAPYDNGYKVLSLLCGGPGKDPCLQVDTTLEKGFWILLGAIVLFYFLGVSTAIALSPTILKKEDVKNLENASSSGAEETDLEAGTQKTVPQMEQPVAGSAAPVGDASESDIESEGPREPVHVQYSSSEDGDIGTPAPVHAEQNEVESLGEAAPVHVEQEEVESAGATPAPVHVEQPESSSDGGATPAPVHVEQPESSDEEGPAVHAASK